VHRQGFFHRDLKPDNLLWQGETLKIADFGLAREIRSRPPFTEYCGTRWYRAPEIILRSEFYNSPVDIWSAGAIMAELFLGKPLFPGTSETDQIYKIFGVLGPPTQKTWPDGIRLANRIGIRFAATPFAGMTSVLPNLSAAALSLLSDMLRFDPAKRPSASQALQHEWFGESTNTTAHDTRAPDPPRRRSCPSEPGLDEIISSLLGHEDPDDYPDVASAAPNPHTPLNRATTSDEMEREDSLFSLL
jgi:protein kinase